MRQRRNPNRSVIVACCIWKKNAFSPIHAAIKPTRLTWSPHNNRNNRKTYEQESHQQLSLSLALTHISISHFPSTCNVERNIILYFCYFKKNENSSETHIRKGISSEKIVIDPDEMERKYHLGPERMSAFSHSPHLCRFYLSSFRALHSFMRFPAVSCRTKYSDFFLGFSFLFSLKWFMERICMRRMDCVLPHCEDEDEIIVVELEQSNSVPTHTLTTLVVTTGQENFSFLLFLAKWIVRGLSTISYFTYRARTDTLTFTPSNCVPLSFHVFAVNLLRKSANDDSLFAS